jgi:alkylhydroperoxidase/carboxymuconolactone decarboxylase family protein YurZ
LSTITDFAFGEIWERPGLTEQERALLSLAVVVALNLEEPMKNYIRACLNVGVPKDKVLEALLHLSMYVGMPLISRGFAAANQVLAEREGTHP